MGKRGPKPKPTPLKILTGNPGKRALSKREPRPQGAAPKCPAWLLPEARKRWKGLAPELTRLGLLTALDGDALAAYCQAWALYRLASETLARDGTTTETGLGGIKPHPALAELRQASADLRAFGARFGLDPSSRAGLGASGAEEKDEFSEFLARKRG